MAPNGSPHKKPTVGKGRKGGNKSNASAVISKISNRSKPAVPIQQKTKSQTGPVKKKRKVYTEKELGIPRLNTITPVGVDMPAGKKKGKVFVDDQESMMTILSIVQASKEGLIESKMMKSRHMEEIREARRKEAEAKQEQKQSKLDETKNALRRKRKRKPTNEANEDVTKDQGTGPTTKTTRKRVTFA